LVKNFRIHDYTMAIIRDPERFSATDLLNPKSSLYPWTRRLAPFLYPWIPTYVWILTKSEEVTRSQSPRVHPGCPSLKSD
jgi:Gpi18-like mannosyltransferase